MCLSLFSASARQLKDYQRVKKSTNSSDTTFWGQEWFVYLKVSALPAGLQQSSPTYWLADAFWGPKQLLRIQRSSFFFFCLMEIKGEACIIYTHALNDLSPIILVWNQFVSLHAFVYLLSCWDEVKN